MVQAICDKCDRTFVTTESVEPAPLCWRCWLGVPDDEWVESAENEPDADEADREWAQMLTEETEDEQC